MRHAQHFAQIDGRWECSDNNCRAVVTVDGVLTHKPGCVFSPERYGHDLAREIIARHGRDRFPTVTLNLLQLGSEVGELLGAWAKALDDQEVPMKELGDAGLALFEVANKLGLNLIEVMAEVVDSETRRFKT